jgi:hypothetical protein
MVRAVEAMADAIMQYEGWRPGTRSYQNRNPGNLRTYGYGAKPDDKGFTMFQGLSDGYAALVHDIERKCEGFTGTHLEPKSTLLQFFQVYAPASDHNTPLAYAQFVAHWMTVALKADVTPQTMLAEIYPGPIVTVVELPVKPGDRL